MQKAVQRARENKGPSLIHTHVIRLLPHSSSDDHRKYRTAKDIELDRQRDPIPRLARLLIEQGYLLEDEADKIKEEVKHTVDDAAEWAESQSLPDPSTVMHNLYGISYMHRRRTLSNRRMQEIKSL